jgi:hypothetical protein
VVKFAEMKKTSKLPEEILRNTVVSKHSWSQNEAPRTPDHFTSESGVLQSIPNFQTNSSIIESSPPVSTI